MLTVTREAIADDVDYLLWRLDPAGRAEVAAWASAPVRRLRANGQNPASPVRASGPTAATAPDGTQGSPV
jgi:hypothetical protein